MVVLRSLRPLRSPRATLLLCVLGLVGCKDIAETVVEQGVKTVKETAKGIEEGLEKGRKHGESVDDALIVSRPEELAGKAAIQLRAVRRSPLDPQLAEVEFAVENRSERPLRLTRLEALALDAEGFAQRSQHEVGELTVPVHAKERLAISFPMAASAVAKVRLWGVDYDAPAILPE